MPDKVQLRLAQFTLDQLPLAVIWVSRAGRLVLVNAAACRILRTSSEDLLARSFSEIAPELADCLWREHWEAVRAGRSVVLESTMQSHYGPLPVTLTLAGLTLGDEDYFCLFARPAAEPPSTEEQLLHARKMEVLGGLATGIAHEFNNLLMAILGNADLALLHLSNVSPACPMLQEIERASKRAANLCRQILVYSSRGGATFTPVSLNRIIDEVNDLLTVAIPRQINLRFNLTEPIPAVEGDMGQILQFVVNLVLGGAEAIGERKGLISISTGAIQCDADYLRQIAPAACLEPGAYVYLEVSDTGPGLSREAIERIENPRLITPPAGREAGLAYTRGIMQTHHGALKIYSEPGREGTTIKLLFPESMNGTVASAAAQSGESPWRGAGTILVVDDEEHIRTRVRGMLLAGGFKVLLASGGDEALRIFREHADAIGCVLLDFSMPGMDGEEVFRELRRIRPAARVILVSGYGEQDVLHRFVGKGLSGFLQKPYQMRPLLESIHKALEG